MAAVPPVGRRWPRTAGVFRSHQVEAHVVKSAKYVLYGVSTVAALALLAVGAVVFIVDGAFVKGRLQQLMSGKHRTLTIDGTPTLTLFPVARITLGRLSLSEVGSDTNFVVLDSADVAVRVMPLLSGVVQLELFKVTGLRARVISDKNGKLNYSDLLDPTTPNPTVHVAEVNIAQAQLYYHDELTGQALTLVEMKLTAGRLDGVIPGPVALAARIVGHQPEVDLHATISGALRYDLAKEEIGAEQFLFKVDGHYDTDTLLAELTAPRVEISPARATGSAVNAILKLSGPKRQANATLKMAAIEGTAAAFTIPDIAAEWTAAIGNKPFTGAAHVSIKASLPKHTLDATLVSTLDESAINATLNVLDTDPLKAKFDIGVDHIDLDRYIPAARKGAKSDSVIDLSMLKGKSVNGTFHADALTMSRARLQKVAITVALANGTLTIGPHSASLYGGTLVGALSVTADSNRILVKETLENVAVGTLMRDIARQDRFDGRGSVDLDLRTLGTTSLAIKRALNGSVKVSLRDAAIKGVNLAERVRNVKATLLRRKETYDPSTKTDFSTMRVNFTIKNGVAFSDDLNALSPFLRLGGVGNIDFGRNTIAYVANAKVVATSRGQGGREAVDVAGVSIPIQVSGPLDKPEWHIDYSGLARGVAAGAGTLAKKGAEGAGTLAKKGAGGAGTLAKKGAGGAGTVAKKGVGGVGGVIKGFGGRFRKKQPPP